MKFYLATDAANLRRAELVFLALFDAGHYPTMSWRDCGEVNKRAIAEADVIVALLVPASNLDEVLSEAIILNKPILLWREPKADQYVAAAAHGLVYDMLRGDLASAMRLELLVTQAAELPRQQRAGEFGKPHFGHAGALLEAIRRPA